MIKEYKEYTHADLTRFAINNGYLYGPVEFRIVEDYHDSDDIEHHAVVAWAPAIKDVMPQHVQVVHRLLQQPLQDIRSRISLLKYKGA